MPPLIEKEESDGRELDSGLERFVSFYGRHRFDNEWNCTAALDDSVIVTKVSRGLDRGCKSEQGMGIRERCTSTVLLAGRAVE